MAAKSASSDPIIIVGAGLGGTLLACFLARQGHTVEVHERRADPRAEGFAGGRSINLALSTRGIFALEQVDLADQVLADAIAMPGRMLHSPAGELTFQPYSKNQSDAIYSVSRGGLNMTLLDAAETYENVTLYFNHPCVDVNPDKPEVMFSTNENDFKSVPARAVIGADGVYSAVRGRLQKTERFNFSQSYLEHGYKELTIPPTPDGEFALQRNGLHIWPRGSSMMIALPNADRSFTCTLFWPYEGAGISFDAIQSREQIIPFFRKHFPDAVAVMTTLEDDYQNNPVGSLVTIRCGPWHYEDKVVLIGDSAHAIVPFYGQGMNAAFEDCVVLSECLRKHAGDRGGALAEFSRTHKPNGDAIADMAHDNFIEMRDRTGSQWFLFRKRMEKNLHCLLHGWYTPLYHMVTFSRIPYAKARQRAARQRRTITIIALTLALLIAAALLWLII